MTELVNTSQEASLAAPDGNAGQRAGGRFGSLAVPLVIFAILTAAISAVGIEGFRQYRRDVERAVQQNLIGITDAKLRQFAAWREERQRDATAITGDLGFRIEFDRWVKAWASGDSRGERLRQRLVAMRDTYGYEDILLFDDGASMVATTNPDVIAPSSNGMNLVARVLRDGKVAFADISYLRRDGSEHVRFGILAPIFSLAPKATAPIGVILMRIDPTKALFPSLMAWPVPTQSGETFLAKHEGDTITYLSELRQPNPTGEARRFAVSHEKLLAAQTARGREGLLDGEDYRGVAAIGASRLIPDTSWLIVSKIDKAEIYDPIRRTGWIIGIVAFLFIAGAGVATIIWWRNLRHSLEAETYRAQLDHEVTKRRLNDFSKHANDIVLLSDEDARIVDANDRAIEAYGYSFDELRGMHTSELRHPSSRSSYEEDMRRWRTEGCVYETVQRHRDGGAFPVEISARLVEVDGRRFRQAIIRDITERKLSEATIRSGQAQLHLFAQVFEQSGEGIVISDRENRILAVNPAFTRMSGYDIADLRGKNPRVLASGLTPPDVYKDMWESLKHGDYWQGEIWNRRKDGSVVPERLSISVARDLSGDLTHYIAANMDITERKESEAHIQHLAHHDALTGLFNRYNLQNRLEQALATARREQRPLAVMFIDMDDFKSINDTLGHAVGDGLLMEVARRLKDSVRDSDVVARLGGDEFVLVLTEVDGATAAARVADKILRSLGEPYCLEADVLHVTPSIGLAIFPNDGDDGETLMKHADTAMYHAKSQGRNNVQFSASEMNRAAVERLRLDHDLRVALDERQFELHYQPQIDARTGDVVGVEALVRWRHPSDGLVSPLKFIPVAEETGLILPLGEWVLDEACRQLREWKDDGLSGLTMAVNLSAHQLRSPNLIAYVTEILHRHGLNGHDLELEVTESVAMDNPEASIGRLKDLRNLGVRLSIDDFGTGYSSLSYLKLLPIHTLKLDRSFVRDIETDANDVAICTATISLAHNLGLSVVAEGVENSAQQSLLMSHRCDFLQGFLYSKPVQGADASSFIRENRRDKPAPDFPQPILAPT